MKKALMMASVASMIDLFNMDNVKILQNMGFEVHVACNFEYGSITSQERVDEFHKELEHSGIKTVQLSVPRSMSAIKDIITSYKLMKKLCKENHYEIVHCHSPIGGIIARLACKSERKHGTKVIYTAHGFHFFKGASIKNWVFFYPIEKLCAKYTDCLTTINKEDFIRAKKFKTKRVDYVPGIGIHTEDIKGLEVDRNAKRAEFGFQDNDFVLISVGQLSKRKNQEVIIKALVGIPDKHVKLLICGLGELEGYLQNLTKQLHLEDRVIIAGYRSDVKELLHAVDCLVFPSLQEGLPVVLMEAMSAGLPVVCSKIRGNTDLIEDGKGGYLVETDNIKEYAKSICKIKYDPELRLNMISYNTERIKMYDKSLVGNTMKEIYKSVGK